MGSYLDEAMQRHGVPDRTDEIAAQLAQQQAVQQQELAQQSEAANLQNNANFKQFEASQPGPIDTSFSHFVAQENPTFVAEHPTLSKALATPGYALQSLADLLPQPVQNWANRAGQSGGEVMTLVDNPNKVDTGSGLGNTTADLFGGLMGFVGNPTPGGVESAGAKLWQGGEQAIGKVFPRVLPNAPKLAQDALKITGATIPYELTNAYVNNRPINPAEMGTAVGANVLLAGLTHGIGKLGKGATRVEPAVDGVAPTAIETPTVKPAAPSYIEPPSFTSVVEEMKPRINELITPPLESTKGLVDYVHEYFGGQMSKNEIRKASYEELTGIAENIATERKKDIYGLLKTEGEKKGYNIDQLYKLETDPAYKAEHDRLAEVSGLSDNVPLGKGANPDRSVAADMGTPSAQMTVGLGRGVNPTSSLIPQRPIRVPGATPDIPLGKMERGVSENIRTDFNRPQEIRDSYSTNPEMYDPLRNADSLAKAQVIFDKGLESAATELNGLIDTYQPEAAPLVKMIADQLVADGNIVRARELLSNAAVKATEAGQFGQAFRILRDSDPTTFLQTIGKQLKKLNKEGLESYGKKWKDFDLTPEELDMVSKIERGNQQSYESAFETIGSRIANEMPADGWEKVNAWRHISMLLNPKTQIRNVGGNFIMMGMRRSAKQVSAVLQNVLLKPEERTQVFKINSDYKQAATAHFEANKKDLLSGGNKYNEGVKLGMSDKRVFADHIIPDAVPLIGGKNVSLEPVRKFTYKLLEMGDTPFYKDAYINRLASYAQARGIKDFSKLPQEALAIAKMEAEQATYKDASIIADFINKSKNPSKNAGLGRKAGALLTEAALPFTKTPINIIARGVQYSPISIFTNISKWKSAAGIDELAKGLTGTGILGLGYLLASKGILTGKASSDPDLKAYDTNTGNSPFSIMGKFTYDWAQPFSVPLSVGVEIYNAVKDNPQDTAKMNSVIANNDTSRLQQMALTAANGIMEGLNASGDTVFNMSIMKGIKTLLGSGTKGFMEGLAQLPQGYATQFIPTLSSQIAGAIDPLVRNTYVPGNLPASFKNTLISKIPIASKTLQPKQTPYGENMKKIENPLGRAFSQFLSPGIIAKDQGNVSPKIDTELRRLNESGLVNQFPTMVPNYIEKTQTHPKISLSPAETTQYQQRVGQLTLTAFDKLMNQGKYINAHQAKLKSPDEVKADLLATAISDSKATAKKEMLKSRGLK